MKKIIAVLMCLLFLTALFSCQSNYQKKYENFFSSEDSAAETEVKNLIFKMNEAFNRGDYKTSVCAYGYSKKELNDYVDIQKEIAKTLSVKRKSSKSNYPSGAILISRHISSPI